MSALFPKRLRGKLIGLFMGAGSVGSAIGLAVGSWIAVSWGWRYVFGLVAIPGLIFAIMFFFTRDYKTVELTIRASEAKDSAIRRHMTTKDILVSLFGAPMNVGNLFKHHPRSFLCRRYVNLVAYFLHPSCQAHGGRSRHEGRYDLCRCYWREFSRGPRS